MSIIVTRDHYYSHDGIGLLKDDPNLRSKILTDGLKVQVPHKGITLEDLLKDSKKGEDLLSVLKNSSSNKRASS